MAEYGWRDFWEDFHGRWGSDHESPEYDKATWAEMQRFLDRTEAALVAKDAELRRYVDPIANRVVLVNGRDAKAWWDECERLRADLARAETAIGLLATTFQTAATQLGAIRSRDG